MSPQRLSVKIENKIIDHEPDIAKILAGLCYHLHPDIVALLQERNEAEYDRFKTLFAGRIDIEHYLFPGSACVFPGVRRYVSARGKKQRFNPGENAILDDNVFPRHIWCFLLNGTAYSGPVWKKTGLGEFELAHVFAHKPSEAAQEAPFFREFEADIPPYANFTCAANVAILPKGTVRPTDNSSVIKSVFFKRHVDLYGEQTLNNRSGFRHESVPAWYDDLGWNAPLLPPDWRPKVESLLRYRNEKLAAIIDKETLPQDAQPDWNKAI